MLTSERKLFLLDLLKKEGKIVATSVAGLLAVSEDTIRRDLRELAGEGRLQRVHGGALPASPAMADFAAREHIAVDDKSAIGRAAALLIQPGQVVFIDGGTTSAQLVRHLPPDLCATVITHSPSVAVALVTHPHIEVIMLGGRLFKHSVVGVGSATMEAIRQVRADVYFMGVYSVHPEAGLSTGDFEEAGIKRALSAAAAETIVLASPEKLATASPYQVIALDQLSALVTMAHVPEETLAPYRKLGIPIHLA